MNKNFRVKNIDRKKVEELAISKLKAIKLQDNLFIIPGNVASTEIIDENYINNNILSKVIINRINSLDIVDGDNIIINCEAELAANKKVIEVINLRNENAIEFDHCSNLSHESREELVNTIASIIKEKNVIVSYYLPYDYAKIRELVLELE